MICQGLWVKIGELGSYTASSTDKSIINADWFYRHNIDKSFSTFQNEWELITLFSGEVLYNKTTAITLSQPYTNFNYISFVFFSSTAQIYSIEEFNALISISKLRGTISLGGKDVDLDAYGTPYIRGITIDASKSFTSTYWSAAFLWYRYIYGRAQSYNSGKVEIYGYRKK